MQVAYVAGPFRSSTFWGIFQNIRAAEAVSLKYWKLGYAVICPHLNTANFDGAIPKELDSVWLDGDLEIMKRCDVVVAMPTWKNSLGAVNEIRIAIELGIPVIYESPDNGQPE
jgi:hypothetical protein